MDFSLLSAFIENHLDDNPNELALKKPKVPEGLDFRFALEQIVLQKKAKIKLPTFYEKRCFYTTKAFEQSTAEAVAIYKAGLFSGDVLIDLSGGLGVDDWAFAKSFRQVIALDPDENLNELVRYNYSLLGISNIERITTTAEAYLPHIPENSTVYIDPDRRDKQGNRKLLLENCTPNILAFVPFLQKRNCKVIIKLSPMFDTAEVRRKLEGTSTIYAIAYKNELKELLVVCDETKHENLVAVNISNAGLEIFQNINSDVVPDQCIGNEPFFFEPNAPIIKLKLWKEYAASLGLKIFNYNTAFLSGDEQLEHFFGRQFRLQATLSGNIKQIAEYLKMNGITKANITTRNYFDDVEAIRKKLKIADGGEDYLMFFRDEKDLGKVVHCRKV